MEHNWLHGRTNNGVSMAGPDQIWQARIYPPKVMDFPQHLETHLEPKSSWMQPGMSTFWLRFLGAGTEIEAGIMLSKVYQ
jgi:hypothetical protein